MKEQIILTTISGKEITLDKIADINIKVEGEITSVSNELGVYNFIDFNSFNKLAEHANAILHLLKQLAEKVLKNGN